MPIITLETYIKSDINICFDLARSIDLHKVSTEKTDETAVAGITTGLIELDDFVTWKARHFGITQKLSSKITAFNKPFHFRDEQVKGAFKYMKHDHFFEVQGEVVVMKDIFSFQSPLGILGKLADQFVLTEYLKRFLIERNNIIKNYAETEKWKSVLKAI